MVHPAVPRRPDRRGLCIPVVDDPAPLEAERLVDLAALGAVVAVAELVLADELAVAMGPELRPEGLVVPPGEEPGEKSRDFHRVSLRIRAGLSCQRPEPLSRAAQPQRRLRI